MKGHPIHKLFTQEEIDERIEEYERKQKEFREANFELREEFEKREAELHGKGHDRIIITAKPRSPSVTSEMIKAREEAEKQKAKEKYGKKAKPVEVLEEVVEEVIDTEKEDLKAQLAELKAQLAEKEQDTGD